MGAADLVFGVCLLLGGALLLLTQEHLAGRTPRTSAKPIFLDREGSRIDRHGAGPLAPRVCCLASSDGLNGREQGGRSGVRWR